MGEKFTLQSEASALFAVMVLATDGDVENARKCIHVEFDSKLDSEFSKFVNDIGKLVISKGGKMVKGDGTFLGVLRSLANNAKLPVQQSEITSYAAPVLFGDAPFEYTDDEERIGKAWQRVVTLKNAILEAEHDINSATENENALTAFGAFALNWIRLYAIAQNDSDSSSAFPHLVQRMNKIRIVDEFDEHNIRDAILGRGVFASPQGTTNRDDDPGIGYSYLTADERRILDSSLFAHFSDLAQQREQLKGKTLTIISSCIHSSLVHEILYDKQDHRLLVQLDRDRYYQYDAVPGYVVFGLLHADSAGHFFDAEIRGAEFDYREIEQEAYYEIQLQASGSSYLHLTDFLENGLTQVLRRECYDFQACREKLSRIYGHVFDCALYSLEAKLMYAMTSVPVAKVLRWQALEFKTLQETLSQLNQKVATMPD